MARLLRFMKRIKHSEVAEIAKLLVGRRVVHVDNDKLKLDNGIQLKLVGNDGCAGCSSGNYELEELNSLDNIITSVEISDERVEDFLESRWKIFVYADNRKINLASFVGDDGNECYGTGFTIEVHKIL